VPELALDDDQRHALGRTPSGGPVVPSPRLMRRCCRARTDLLLIGELPGG
jgi:hypothetical protein